MNQAELELRKLALRWDALRRTINRLSITEDYADEHASEAFWVLGKDAYWQWKQERKAQRRRIESIRKILRRIESRYNALASDMNHWRMEGMKFQIIA